MFLMSDWQSLGLAVALLLLIALGVAAWRMQVKLRQLMSALNHMPQGLCMYDKNQRLVVCNRQYLELHKLSPKAVKSGRTLRQVIEHRKQTGLLAGDVDQYCRDIIDGIASGRSTQWRVGANDGRTVHMVNAPIPGGGWVTTQEDITEQLQSQRREEEMAATGAPPRHDRCADRRFPCPHGLAAQDIRR